MTRPLRPLLFLIACLALAPAAARIPGLPGTDGGVVATSEPMAAAVGARILAAGGNAVDAAIAVAFALNVTEPQSAGIGGGGFMLVHLADGGQTWVIDSRETAPAAATPDQFEPFIAEGGGGYPLASTSGIAVGVPGMVRGLALAQQRWGRMDWASALTPALRLAADGIRVGPELAEFAAHPRLSTAPGDPAYEVARGVFRPGGAPLAVDQLLRQPDLARTLRLLISHGPDAFYSGRLAGAIVATQGGVRDGLEATRGRMTLADLAGYTPALREPLEGQYRGFRLQVTPPPSSGGIAVLAMLQMLERFPLDDLGAGFGAGQARTLHVMLEAMRLAFADRAVWAGDSDRLALPVAGMIDPAYNRRRGALIDPDRRLPEVGADDPRAAALPLPAATLAATAPAAEGEHTTHFSIVDADGNIVSYTNTIESAWGTGLMVPGYGFLLNNELTDFNFRPRADAASGDPGANDVAPHKRPRSSMTPVLLWHGDRPLAAWGSPGGATIINSVLGVALNLIDHGMTLQEAVDAPRISLTGADAEADWEAGLDAGALATLEALGHRLREPREIGSVQAVLIDPRDGRRHGAADRRRVGAVRSVPRAVSAGGD